VFLTPYVFFMKGKPPSESLDGIIINHLKKTNPTSDFPPL